MSYEGTMALESSTNNMADGVDAGFSNLKQKAKKIGEELSSRFTQSKDRTADSLETVSEKIDTIAHYIKDKNANNMVWDLGQVLRRNPFKTLLVVGVLGVLFCKSK